MAISLKKPTRNIAEENAEGPTENNEEAFRAKIVVQQFLNHNGPLFRAYAKSGTSIDEVLDGDVLRVHASHAMRLAVLIASKVLDKEVKDITAAEANPFRKEASEYVADKWLRNGNIDVDKAAHEIASAVKLADKTFDYDVYKDEKLSNDASLIISSISVVGPLSRIVDIYDFRLGKEEAFGVLVNTLIQTASKMSLEVVSSPVNERDRRNITQTLSRNLCALLEACYERKAVEVSEYLEKSKMSEVQKNKWLTEEQPLNEVLNTFKDWSTFFGAFALTASQGLKNNPATKEETKPS